jgi:NitT/TauT family transport system ATP-binding protein
MSNGLAHDAIRVEGFSLAYQPSVQVLQDIDLTVKQGEFVSLVGPSGCGKTTLLNALAGLVQATTSGKAELMGHAPQLGSGDVAYMLARDSLLPWRDALGNAAFGMEVRGVPRTERERRATSFLKRVGLGGHLHSLPKALSHGMRQRVALARTFAMSSQVLLMDEPFGALDAQTKLHLQDLLLELSQTEKHTVVFVTHDLAEAVAVSDRVIILASHPGRVIADMRIDLPRPRSVRSLQKDPAFHALYAKVWSHLESGWVHHEG